MEKMEPLYTAHGACLAAHPRPGEPFAVAALDHESAALVVCDGTGSWGDGVDAARRGAALFAELLARGGGEPHERLLAAFAEVSTRIVSAPRGADDEPFDSAFSAAAALVVGDEVYLAWAGDCLGYLFREGGLVARLEPHTLIRQFLELGKITPGQALEPEIARFSNVITKVVAAHAPGQPPSPPELAGPWALRPGDTLLICSRGIREGVSDEELLALSGRPPRELIDSLLTLAKSRGQPGEHTAVALEWRG
jgi:serine/threonine protein phosphatase PrpC